MTVERWIGQLDHDDPAVRYEAAHRLGTAGDIRAVDALIKVLDDDNAKVQYAAVSGLVKHCDSRAAWPLIRLLLDEPGSRIWGLLKLNIGIRLRNGLLDMVPSGDLLLADLLTEALRTFRFDEAQQAFLVRLLGRTADARAVEPLMNLLLDTGPAMQQAAAEALGWIGDSRAVDSLLLCLSDDDVMIREVTVEALGRIGDAQALQPLITALYRDREVWVRRAAATALGRLGDPKAVEALADALNDAELVQEAAFEALKKFSSGAAD